MTWSALKLSPGRHVPIVLQAEAAECGLACLAMLLGAHGHRVDLATLRRRHPVSLKGSTLRDLMRFADANGLAGRAVRVELADLGKLRLPCVLHWGMNHFVVLAGVDRKGLLIHDPAHGKRHVALDEASREFTGVALEATPKADFVPKEEMRRLRLSDLFRRAVGLRASLGKILLLSLCVEIAVLLIPIGSQIVIDEVIVSADRSLLLTVGLGLGLLLVIQLVLALARSWAIMVTGATLNYQWNAGLFDHLSRLPLDYFEKRHAGDVLSRFAALGTVQKALTNDLAQAVLDGIMSVGMLVMLFVYGGWLGFVAVAATVLVVGLRLAFYGPYRQAMEEAVVCEARQQSHFIETLRGMASVKLLDLRERRQAVWMNHLVESLNARLRQQRLDILFGRLGDLLFGADRLVLLALGALAVLAQDMTLGMLVAFLAYKDQFTTRIGNLVSSWFQIRLLDVQVDRLADIVNTETEAEPLPAAGWPGGWSGLAERSAAALRIDGISFRYGEGEPQILENLSFEIAPGSSVAITGPSGCGKTTLLKVMMGLLPPAAGAVSSDGADIGGNGAAAYRKEIAGVLQDDGLFAGSIAENIAGFDPQPDLKWIEACAASAAVLNDIRRMPMGFETLVGDMGSALSGGQKQRIILARALYRRPRVLFLDEATSHLDEATEAAIAAALKELRMTRVVVAHRPATIAHCDTVFVFRDGRLTAVPKGRAPTSFASPAHGAGEVAL